ncbi:MAG: hypothetical protein LBK56_08265, partial [Gracilibacteraceae bacterium]|nr:hypothetical protein [Gracilibacteraceae bacterium]
MSDVITESGMNFAADNTFHIEKSPLYAQIGGGVRSVEFVRSKGDKLLFVEAKSSFANPNNIDASNYAKFQSAVEEVCEKFIHSLNMYASVEVGTANVPFPDSFQPPITANLTFVLVVKGHEHGWCMPISESLVEALPIYIKKIWRPTVYVVNQETAKKWHLIA